MNENVMFANDDVNRNLHVSYDGGLTFQFINKKGAFSGKSFFLGEDSLLYFSGFRGIRTSKDYGKTIQEEWIINNNGDTIVRQGLNLVFRFANGNVFCNEKTNIEFCQYY